MNDHDHPELCDQDGILLIADSPDTGADVLQLPDVDAVLRSAAAGQLSELLPIELPYRTPRERIEALVTRVSRGQLETLAHCLFNLATGHPEAGQGVRQGARDLLEAICGR